MGFSGGEKRIRHDGEPSGIGIGTGGARGAIAPPIFLEGGLSPLHLQPSIVTIQSF